MTARPRLIALVGDSMIGYFQGWAGLAPESEVVNLGQGGDNTFCVLRRLGELRDLGPDLVFLQVGINDLLQGRDTEALTDGHVEIWRTVSILAPLAKLVVGSILPLNSSRLGSLVPGNALVRKANSALATAAEAFRIEFLDHYWLMAGPDGELRPDLTDDGIHLLPQAYWIWLQALKGCPAFGA